MTTFESLTSYSKFFEANPERFERLLKGYPDYELREFFRMVEESEMLGIRGIHEQLNLDGGLGGNLRSAMAEFRLANTFKALANVSDVNFIVGNNKKSSPDIGVTIGGKQIFVEVASLKDDDTALKVQKALEPLCKKLGVVVHFHWSASLSTPVITSRERSQRDALVEVFCQDVSTWLNSCSVGDERQFEGAKLTVSAAPTGGYLGGGFTDAFLLEEDSFEEKLSQTLIKKASKHKDLDSDRPYLIAVENRQMWFGPRQTAALLYGPLRWAPLKEFPFSPARLALRELRKQQRFIDSYQSDWQSLLDEAGFDPDADSFISQPGIFLTDKEMLAVTGVILHSRGNYHYFPNPFGPYASIELLTQLPWPTTLRAPI